MKRDTVIVAGVLSTIGLAIVALMGTLLVVGYKASHGPQRPGASATCDPDTGYNTKADCEAALALLGDKGHCAVIGY